MPLTIANMNQDIETTLKQNKAMALLGLIVAMPVRSTVAPKPL